MALALRDRSEEMPPIGITMPAYNCRLWLDDFMNSLLSQEVKDWRLIARDDCSRDGTAERLEDWRLRLGERMTVLPGSTSGSLGVIGNYNAVLAACNAAWIMTADPDDVWLPGKISSAVHAMRNLEARFGTLEPIAICTDAMVVDEGLRPIASSYWHSYRMNPRLAGKLSRTAVESVALGSTMMVNRPLLDLALPIEAGSPYQDWWFALVAAAFGRTIALHDRAVLYRRHDANQTQRPFLASPLLAISMPGAARKRTEKLIAQAALQARVFVARYRGRLDLRSLAALEALAALPQQGALARRLSVLRHGLWFGSPLKNLGLIALV